MASLNLGRASAAAVRFAPVLALALLAAGCAGPDDDPAPPPQDDSYRLAVANVPATPVAPNSTFTFDLAVDGDEQRTSDHIGAHFGNSTTTQPSTTVYASTCQHQGGALPGHYQVTCTAPATPGIYFLRGHARIIQDNATTQWWSAEATFTVA